jgi:hypothetical protein
MSKELNFEETSEVEEIGLLRKNLFGIIDAAIIITVFLSIASFFPLEVLSKLGKPFRPELCVLLSLAIYRLISLVIFNSTAGMRICRIVVLNDDLEILSLREKVLASFFILINGVAYYRKA